MTRLKNHAATIVLVVLSIALGLWLWLDRDRVTAGERQRRENNVFVAWRREELSQITIAHDDETIVLERDLAAVEKRVEGKEGVWRMTSPRQERADPVAVDRLVTTLELATVARKAGDGPALGLDRPRMTGSIRMGSLVLPFALGGFAPRPEGASYFRVGDEPPIVVTSDLALVLAASSDTYRSRTVVPYVPNELARVEVTHPSGGFVLERIDEHAFRVADAGLLASRGSVDRLWVALAGMRAEAFPKDVDVDRLTARPALTIKLTPKDGTKPAAELVIGEACPGHPADVVVLRKAPQRGAACAPKDIAPVLAVDGAALVEKHLFTLRMDEIDELRLEKTPGSPLEIARKGTTFHQRAPDDRDLTSAEADAATELLTRIASSEAKAVLRGAGAAPLAAIGRARIHSGEREQVIEIGALRGDGGAMLRRALDDARLEVDASVVRRLMPRATSVRSRALVEGETRKPTRLVLRCGTEQELVDRGEGFRLIAPAGYETEGSITQLVEGILRGKIDTWVADGEAESEAFGFVRDGCRVVVGFEDGNAPLTLSFGGEGEGGVYARLEGAPSRAGVMVAPRSLRDLAGRIYVSRATPRVEPSRVESVRVTYEGKPVAPPPDANAWREAVGALVADSVVALVKNPDVKPDLVIEIATAEGGPLRRVACGPSSPSAPATEPRHCVVSGVAAVFSLSPAKLTAFLPRAPAARDAGRD